mgnify:CR=1 FL=1
MEKVRVGFSLFKGRAYYERKEYDYKDVIDRENIINKFKEPYIESILVKKIQHIKIKKYKRPRKVIAYGMACRVLFLYVRLIIEELFKGNEIEIKGVVNVSLRTIRNNPRYRGWKADRRRSKRRGWYTMIHTPWLLDTDKLKYLYPRIFFSKSLKRRLHRMENNGYKF